MGAIEGLESLTALETLELGSNRLRTLEGLHALHGLQNLWLGRNRIADLATLPPYVSVPFFCIPFVAGCCLFTVVDGWIVFAWRGGLLYVWTKTE